MVEVVSIKFKNRGKCYFFSPNSLQIRTGDKVIVETAKGLEIADCCRGIYPPGEAIDRIKLASRRYAKRQLTWLRRDAGLHWIAWDGAPDIPAARDELLALWDKK